MIDVIDDDPIEQHITTTIRHLQNTVAQLEHQLGLTSDYTVVSERQVAHNPRGALYLFSSLYVRYYQVKFPLKSTDYAIFGNRIKKFIDSYQLDYSEYFNFIRWLFSLRGNFKPVLGSIVSDKLYTNYISKSTTAASTRQHTTDDFSHLRK